MSDRSGAALFADVFEYLARNPTEEAKAFARHLWEKIGDYDFNPYQLYCDDALVKLGLAHMGIDPEYPDDGERLLYGPG
jgi:hypothetical protein